MDEPYKLNSLNHRAGVDDAAQPVSGINVFWIIFVLGITSAWHPLGSSVGFPHKIRRYIRIFPLTALFDTVLLYGELVACMLDKKRSLRASARSVSISRLYATVPSVEGIMGDDEGGSQWLKAMIAFIGLDVRARFLGNALVIFAYTKMFGYSGTPISLSITTLQFASWVGNEVFLLLTYGFSWARTTQQLAASVDTDAIPPTRTLPGFPGLISKANRLLFAVQVTALVAVGLWSIASTTHQASPTPLPADALGFWGTVERILDKLFVPLMWYFDWATASLASLMDMTWSFSPFVAIILSPIFILVVMLFLLPAALLITFTLAGFSILLCSPLLLLSIALAFLIFIYHKSILVYERLPAVVWARVGTFFLLVGLLVYYLHYWDSDGTSKAPWTENLG